MTLRFKMVPNLTPPYGRLLGVRRSNLRQLKSTFCVAYFIADFPDLPQVISAQSLYDDSIGFMPFSRATADVLSAF